MKPEAISKDTVRSFLYLFFVLISLLLPITHGGVHASMSSDSNNDLEVFPSNINALFENTQTVEELSGVSISSNNSNPSLAKAGDDVTLIFTTNEDIENVSVVFQSGSSAVLGSYSPVKSSINTWTTTYTVDANDKDGNVSFVVNYNVVGESAATPVTTGSGSVTVDTSSPSISSITTSWGSILNAVESNANDNNVIITTSEDLGGQDVSVSLNAVTYTGSITSNSTTVPIPSSDLKSLVDGNSYTLTADISDAAGNPAEQFKSSFGVDTVLPEMIISSGEVSNGEILNNTEISLTFSSTEQTSDFIDIDDIVVIGGSIDDFIPDLDGKTFTANFSVSNAGDGTYTIDVNSGSFTDAAGNPNSEAPQFSWTSDTTPPTMTITPNNASNFVSTSDGLATNIQAVSFILESDEQIANFVPEVIELSEGLSYLSGEDIIELEAGRRYRIDLESTSQGSKSITIPINSFQDIATNKNNTSVQFSWTYDSSPPVVSSISAKNLENNAINNASTTNDQTIVLEFITNEPIIGLIGDEIIVSPDGKGTFSALQALQEDTYRISFNPTSDDTFTFYIDSNSFEDKVGNVNTAASSNFLWSYDNTAPIITVSPASQTLEKGGNFVNPTVTASDNGNDISSEIVVGGQAVNVDEPSTYTITYNVSDTAGNSATEQTHIVTVEDTIAPIITSSNEVSIDENIGTGQVIYTITANDPNSTFGIKGTDKDEFSVDPSTGELTLLANPDFEIKSEYDDIIVMATDEFGNTRELPIIVTINNVDEISPEVNSAVTSTSTSIVIGFSEPIVNNNVTSSDFTISGVISNPTVSLITFSASSITLSLTDPIAFDENVLVSYVQSLGSIDDASGNSLNDFVNQVVTNNLLDNESPIITSPSSIPVDENIGSSQVVYTVNATDNDQISSYEITGGADASSFSIDPVSGEVRLLLDPNYENKSSYLFTVRASDPSNNLSNNFTVTVVINDLDEIPPTLVLNGDSFVTAEAGQPYSEPDPAYTVDDNNGEENVTVELQGVVNTNQIDSYNLVYTATDTAGNETTRTRTVQVADNTPPVITLTPYQETVYLNVNESYTLPVLTIDDFDENPTIVIPDAPDTSKVGTTRLIWIATDNENLSSSKTQTVIVGQPPTITLFGDDPQKINLGTAFAEPGASAVDYLDADLSESLVISYSPDDTSTDTVRGFNAHYSVTDSNGVTTNVTRRFDVVDNIIPVLSFTNPTSTSSGSAITWPVKTTYIDPGGVEASDNYDDDATLVIDKVETVDTSTLNSENFVYFDTEDSSGNNATQLVRTVQMVDQTPPSVEFENPSQSEIRVVRKGVFTQPVIELSDNYDPSSDIILNTIIRNGNGNIVPVINTYVLDTYTITYSAEDTSGNVTASEDQITTTIIMDPIVDASASSTVVCAGESVTLGSSDTDLQDTNGNNYTIEWTSSPDIGVELGNTPIVTAIVTQTTTFTLTLRDSDGNTFPDSSNVQVNPLPSFTVQEDAEICEGSSIDLGIGIADESSAGYAYRWESANIGFISSTVNPSYTPISSDTVTLTVTSPAGCQESDSFEITVVEKPIITFPTGDEFEICEGDTFNITSSLFNVQNSENYSWSVTPQGTGTFEESETDPDVLIFTPNSSGIAAGQVLLTLTATDQTPCTGSKAESITLDISPQATLSISPVNFVVCSTSQIEIDIVGDNYDINSLIATPSSALVNLSSKKIFYTPSASDITNGSVTIGLSANQLSPCTGTISTGTTISVIPQATVDITSSPIVECYDPASPLISLEDSGAEIANAASFEWRVTSGGGSVVGGDFSDPKTWFYSPPTSVPTTATLELFVTPNSPCPDSEVTPQTLVIELHQTPEIIKKSDNITFCEGDDIEITSDIIEYNNTSQSDFLWSTSSGVTLPGSFTAGTSSSAYSIYQPSQEDIDNGFVDLIITVTPNSSSACEEPVSETIRFNVNKTKIVELGDPVDVCESQGYFDLVNSTITDTNDPPNPYTPTSGISWERADNGSVDGFNSSTSLTPRFTFSQSDIDNGQVIVKMTYNDGLCNTISDTKIINIIRTPFADLGAPIDICVGDQTVLNNFTIRPVGVGNITWELLADSGATGLSLVGNNSPTPTLDAEDTATGSYELKVTIDPVDGCGDQVVETVDVNVIEKPTIDLSLVDPDNFEVCQGDDFTFSIDDINILTEHAGGYIWSSFGDGFFDQPGNLTSNLERPNYYSPGPNDIASGSVELKLTLTPQNPCPVGDYFQTITIPISRNPVIQGPDEIDICVSEDEIVLSEYFSVNHSSEFTYLWETSSLEGGFTLDQTSLNNTYEPSTGEKVLGTVVLTLTATDVGCNVADVKNITIYYNENPTVDAGPDDVLCESTVEIPLDGDFFVDERANNSGYIVYWTAVNGDSNGYFLDTGTVAKPKYIPQGSDFDKTDTTQEGLKLRLTLESTVTCETLVSDEVEFWFEPKPTVSLPADLDVCSSISSIQLSAAAVQNEDPSSYNWESSGDGKFDGPTNDSSANVSPVYYFGDQDITNGSVEIKLTVNGNDGCSNTEVNDTQTITLIPQPTADLSGETMTVCYPTDPIELANWPGEELDIIDVFGTDAVTNIGRVEWTSSDGVITNSNSLSPIFKPTNNSGTAELTLTVYPINESTCTLGTAFCCGTAESTLTVNIVQKPTITFPSNKEICQGESLSILPNEVDLGDITDRTLLWEVSTTEGQLSNFTSLTPSFVPLADQVGDIVFTLTITPQGDSLTECTDPVIQKQFTLTITPVPIVDAGPPEVPICIGDSYTTNFANVQYSSDSSTWEWSTDSPSTPGSFRLICDDASTENNSGLNVTYCPSQDDYDRGFVNLTLTVPNEGVCIDNPDRTDTITLRFKPKPTVEIKGDEDGFSTTFCYSENYEFSDGQVSADNESSYKWERSGDGTFLGPDDVLLPTYDPGPNDIQSGGVTLKLTVFGADGCVQSTFDEIELTILPEPSLNFISPPTSACINDEDIFINVETNLDNYNISWTVDPVNALIITEGADGLSPTFKPLQTGSARITATINGGDPCSDPNFEIDEYIDVDVVGLPEITSFPSDQEVCFEDTITLEAPAEVNEFVDSLLWTDYYFTLDNSGNELPAIDNSGNPLFGTFANTTNPDFGLYTPPNEINDYDGQVYVRLTMTASGSDPPCDVPDDDVNQSFTLTLTPAPEVTNADTLWGDALFCPDESNEYEIFEAALLSNASSFTWSSLGAGDWSDVTEPKPSYKPTQDEIDAGEFTIILTVNGNGNCSPIDVKKTIKIVTTPVITLSDLEVCHEPLPINPTQGFEITPDVLQNFASNIESTTGIKWSSTTSGTFSNVFGDPQNGYSTSYFPSSEDYTNGDVIITLTAYPEQPCALPVSETMTLTFTEEPTVNLGGPYSVCEDQQSVQLDGSVINGSGLSWSTTTDGVFQDSGGSSSTLGNAVYEFGPQDYVNGSVTLTLTAGGLGVCGTVAETVVIPLIKEPVLEDVVGDISLCTGEPYVFNGINITNYSSYVWTTTGKGTFANKSSAIGGIPTYTPNPNDLDEGTVYFDVVVTPNGPCTEQLTYRKTITYVLPVEVDLGESFEFCEEDGSTFTVNATVENASSVQWRIAEFKGTGTLTNSTNEIVEYTPSVEDWKVGSVTLELTAQAQPLDVCGEVTKQIIIDLIGAPVIDAGESDTICLGQVHTVSGVEAINYDLFNWQHNGEGTLTTDPNDPTIALYEPSSSDDEVTLTLTLTNQEDTTKDGGCDMTSSDTVVLTVTPQPTVNAGPDQTVCEGEAIDLMGATTNAAATQWVAYYNDTYNTTKEIVSGTFSPSNTENTTFTPASQSVYTAAITRGGIIMELTADAQNACGEESDTALITFDSKPVISAGIDADLDGIADPIEVCEGDLIELSLVSPSVSFGTNYQWSRINGDGTFSGNITSSVLEPTYTPGPQDVADGFVVLRLSADPVNACSTLTAEEFYDEIRINITRQPTLTLTSDEFFICAGYEDEAFAPQPTRFEITGVSTNYSENISWRVISGNEGGDFEFGTNNLINPTFELNPTFSGQIVLEAMVIAPGACDERVDIDGDGDLNDEDQSIVASIAKQVTLNVSPIAELTFGNTIDDGTGTLVNGEVICAGASTHTLNTNADFDNIGDISWSVQGGLGSIISGGETLAPVYEPGVDELGDIVFTVTADAVGDCNYTIKREFILRIVGDPTVGFNPMGSVCSNEDISISGVSSNSAQLIFESTGTGGVFYDPLDPTKNSDSIIDIAVADQSSYSYSWKYTPSESDLQNPGGISIIVRAAPLGDSNCENEAIDVINISFSPSPEVSVMLGSGPHAATLCANDTYALDQATVENESYFSWTSSGTGEFLPSAEVQNPIYVPSDLDKQLGNPITLTLTAQGRENCSEASDSIELSIDPLPFVEIPNSTTLHCEEDNIDLATLNVFAGNYDASDTASVVWSSSSSGEFVEDTSFPLEPIYQINASDKAAGEVTLFVRVYGDGECAAAYDEDQIVVQLSNQPAVSYLVNGSTPPSLEICEGETSITLSGATYNHVDLIDGIQWSHNGSGYFDQDNIAQPTYFPDAADYISGVITFNVVASNAGACPAAPLSIDLKLIQQPTIVADKTFYTVCYQELGTEVVLSGVQDITNYSSFQWTVTDGQGNFQDPKVQNPIYVPSGNDFEGDRKVTVLLTVSPEAGCNFSPITKGFEIEFVPEVVAYAGLGGTICSDEQFQISGANVENAVSWEWSNGGTDGFFNNPNLLNPIYTPGPIELNNARLNNTPIELTLRAVGVNVENDSDADCLTDEQSISLNVESDINIYAGPDEYLCTDENFVQLSGQIMQGNPLISWRNDFDNSFDNFDDPTSITPKYYPTQEDLDRGFVTLKVAGESLSGCSVNDIDKVTITFVPAVDAVDQDGNPLTSAGEDDSVCAGSTYIVSDAYINEGSWDTVTWTKVNGQGNLFNINSLTPEYRSVLGDDNTVTLNMTVTSKQEGCLAESFTFSKTLTITGNLTGPGEIVPSPNNNEVCEGDQISYSVDNLTGAADYEWTIPMGASYVSGEGTSTIVLLYDSITSSENTEISVRASNNCPDQVRLLSLPITIQAEPKLTLVSGTDSETQSLCYEDKLEEIVYQLSGGAVASDIDIVWSLGGNDGVSAPDGFTVTKTSNQIRLNGTYSSSTSQGIYNYAFVSTTATCYNGDLINDSATGAQILGEIELMVPPTLTLTSAAGSDNQAPLCSGNTIDDIEYSNSGSSLSISWSSGSIPSGITYNINADPFIISGNPTVQAGVASSTYTYTLVAYDTNGCPGEPVSGTIIVDALSPVEPSSSNLNDEIYCQGDNISFTYFLSETLNDKLDIEWTITDYDSDGNASSQPTTTTTPSGITPLWNFTNSRLTITGSPSAGPEFLREYSFEIDISSEANACTGSSSGLPGGVFKISQNPSLSLHGGQLEINGSPKFTGPRNQPLCDGDALDEIFIHVGGTNMTPVAIGLPIGISQPIQSSSDPSVYIIQGTPSPSNSQNEFNYEIVVDSEYGCRETFTGTISLDKNYDISLTSSPATDGQEICGNSNLQPIIYSYSPGVANATVSWEVQEVGYANTSTQKPAGVVVNYPGSSVSIEGSPSAIDVNGDGVIDQNVVTFTVEATSPRCKDAADNFVRETKSGEFKVTPLPTLTRTSQFATQSVCEDEPLEISFEASPDVRMNLTWSQQILGNNLTMVPEANNVWKLSGSVANITETLSLDYTLIAIDNTSQCSSVPVIGTILLQDKHELTRTSGSNTQEVCEGEPIIPIVYEFGGGASSVRTTTLPPGLLSEIDSDAKTLTIFGTPTSPVSQNAVVKDFSVETIGSGSLCSKIDELITITLTPKPRFSNTPQNYIVCEGEPITNIQFGLLDGANEVVVNWDSTPPGIIDNPIDFSTSPPTFSFSGTPSGITSDTSYTFTLTALNSTTGCASDSVQGTITVQNEHEISRLQGSSVQELCEGEEIDPIVYQWGGGATSAQVNGLPTGLRVETNNNLVTISGTPTVLISQDEDFQFKISTQNNIDNCIVKEETVELKIIKQPSIEVYSGSRIQSGICEGEDIDPIQFQTFNGATNVQISWDKNPPGTIYLDDSQKANGLYTLKGSIDGFDQDQTYNYTLTAINLAKGCESIELEGSLGVQKGHELRRLSSYSSTQQKICEGLPMVSEIIYEFGGGASSAEVIGLPPGLDWNIDDTLNRLTISGTPIVDVSEFTEYDYKVISLGNDCDPIELDGKLTVEPDAEISLESPIATANQFICEGFPIEEITYTFGGGAIDVIYNGLPAGLTPVITYDPVDPNKVSKLTISGTANVNVSDDTEFEYSVKALNNNGCVQPELKGTITIKANAELTLLSSSLSKDQIVCIGTEIIPVNIGYVNSEIPSVSGMPDGLYTTTDAANGILTIQGSVTELQLGNPNRKLTIIGTNTNGCRSQEIEIDIEVQPSYSIKPTRIVDDILDTNNPSGASYVKNITCYDNNDGEIMVNLEVGGSTTDYIFSWTGPNNYVNTTQNNRIKNLSAGIYVVQVEAQGARDCSISQTYTIAEPDPVNIITNEIRPVSCTGSEDGLISVTIDGGNENFYRNFIWEVLQEDVSCTTYTVRLRDNDNDGIFDIIDADIDNDGSIDPGKTDVNNDGMIDEANDPNYSFGTVSYQSCDGVFIQNNILRGEFSANGIYQVCAIPNTIAADAKLDHDLDPDTDNIASVTISGGSASCSAGTWTKIDRLKGSSLASNLIEGIYRLTVIEGPDLNDIESNDLESLRNDPDICVFEEIYELPKDQILYGSVRVDETYCSLTGGYIDIDVNQSAGAVYFYYDGVRVPNTDVEVIAAEFGINTYRVLIQNPNSNGSFEIRNATGCGVVVAQDLLDTNVLTPIISYTSPELEKYGTISERSNILFTLAGNTSYYRVEWDFGDASPVAVGERVSHQYFADGTYTVTVYVYNASGCFTTVSEEIVVGKGYTILMPNAFSPNGDNINEIIGPVFTGLKAVEYYIYNSQGILVYQEFVSEDNLSPNGTIEIMGWDGENSDPSSNFYVFKIIGTRINEELVTRTGTVFLIE